MAPSDERGGWATDPQDARERTCEWALPPAFGVRHRLRVDRAPEPEAVTVTRTCRATVEWTADCSLPVWLRAVAEFCTPYGRRTRGDDTGSPADSHSDGDTRIPDRGAVTDGRFRAAPVEATVRPPDDSDPGLSGSYHYWNTPLARLRADEHFPNGVGSATVDLPDGPDAVWTGASAVGATVRAVPDLDADAHARVGLEAVARERFRRSTTGDADGWRPVGDPGTPDLEGVASLVAATMAPAVENRLAPGELDRALRATVDRVEAVRRAFALEDGDPYRIPDRAVETATAPLEDP